MFTRYAQWLVKYIQLNKLLSALNEGMLLLDVYDVIR